MYSKSSRGYENSGEDTSAAAEDYAPRSQAKKTVILAIPVKLALQQSLAEREKPTSSYGNVMTRRSERQEADTRFSPPSCHVLS